MIRLSSGISTAMTLDISGVQEFLFYSSCNDVMLDVGVVHEGEREASSCIRVCAVKMKTKEVAVPCKKE
jgi:hypothetical protein